MKTLTLAIVCALLAAGPLSAQTGNTDITPETQTILKKNILRNLEHRITDIRANTLQLIIDLSVSHPEVDLDFALLPTMHILKQDDHEGLRILAAVALYHIGGERGQFAVQRRSLYDDSPRVARNCSRLSLYWGEQFLSRGIGNPADQALQLARLDQKK